MEEGNGHSTVWARLASVEDAYLKLLAERDTAILERDKARAALIPILEQVEKLRETVLAQLPKQDKRLPSARVAYQISDELVDRWVEQYERGISLTRIAADSRTHTDTVRKYLQARDIEVRGKRRYGHGQRKETCPGCGDELPAGDEGLCPACQAVNEIVEDRKAARGTAGTKCQVCGLSFDSLALQRDDVPPPVDGVCGLCQYTEAELAARRESNGHTS